MRILVISDIHGNKPALDAVLNDCGPVDMVICPGDIAGYYPFVNEVIDTLFSMENMICVMGNHDYALVNQGASTGSFSADRAISIQKGLVTKENLSRLRGLRVFEELEVGEQRCFLFHGSLRDPLNGRDMFWAGDLASGMYLCGHTHAPQYLQSAEKNWAVVNPGSCGMPRDGNPKAAYCLWDMARKSIKICRVEYPISAVMEKCQEVGLPDRFWKSLQAGRWVSDAV